MFNLNIIKQKSLRFFYQTDYILRPVPNVNTTFNLNIAFSSPLFPPHVLVFCISLIFYQKAFPPSAPCFLLQRLCLSG